MNQKKINKNVISKKIKKLKTNKKLLIIGIILLVILIMFFNYVRTGNTISKYGNRLNGIKKVPVKKEQVSKIEKRLKENENVTYTSVRTEGKIIYVTFNVKQDLTVDDAKNIGNTVLEVVDDKIKNFYDINIIITKKDEVGEEVQVTTDSGEQKTETKKEFPIMGYKKSSSEGIVW